MRIFKRMLPYYIAAIAAAVFCSLAASRCVTAFSEAAVFGEQQVLPVVVLDPGHGGEDGGAVSPGGLRESAINLEIGLRTRDLLRFLGLSVTMTT